MTVLPLSCDQRQPRRVRAPRKGASRWALLLVLMTGPVGGPALCGAQVTGADGLVLTTAASVHELPAAMAPGARVHLRGTVSYYDPYDTVMFLQDKTGGVYVDVRVPYPVRTGDLIEVDGKAHASYRTEVMSNPAIRVVGKGDHYSPTAYTYHELAMGKGDCSLVKVRGVVRAQDLEQHTNSLSVHLDLMMEGGEAQVYLDPSFGLHPESLLDATVEMTGVAGGEFDVKDQITGIVLYVPGKSDITVLSRPAVSLANLPLTDIDDVFRSRNVEDRSERVRVRGALTYYHRGDAAVLEHDGKAIYVQTRMTDDFAIGDVVDAFGFASDREYAPSLRQASIVKTGQREVIKPRLVSYKEAVSGIYSDNLIAITGKVVSQVDGPYSDTIVIDVDGHTISGKLMGVLPMFEPNTEIRLSGISRVVPGGPFRLPTLFHLEMRDATDAQVIARPSWWTVRHLIEMLIGLLAVAVSIATWALLLRRRLVKQTSGIKRSMMVARERTRILEKISSNQAPDILLTAICDSVKTLLPGVDCSYSLQTGDGAGLAETEAEKLFAVVLTGDNREAVGWIVVTADGNFSMREDCEAVYEMLSETATLAIRQSLLHQALVHHSTHDALTELPNRRLSDMRLSMALDEAAFKGSGLAVIYIDIDRFKEVNDRFGHKVGDLYLRQISGRLLATKRMGDTLARIGGDEFLVIIPLGPMDDPEALMDRLRTCFDEPFLLEGEMLVGSASFGLARYPEHGYDAESLKRNADHAMYLSKRSRELLVVVQ